MRPSRLIESRPAIASEARKKMCPFSASARIVSRPGAESAANEIDAKGKSNNQRRCLRMRVTYTRRRDALSHELSNPAYEPTRTKPRNHEKALPRRLEGTKTGH